MSNQWITVRTAYQKILDRTFSNPQDRDAAHTVNLKLLWTAVDMMLSGEPTVMNAFKVLDSIVTEGSSASESQSVPVPQVNQSPSPPSPPSQQSQTPSAATQQSRGEPEVNMNLNDFFSMFNFGGNNAASGGGPGDEMRQLLSMFPYLSDLSVSQSSGTFPQTQPGQTQQQQQSDSVPHENRN